MDKKQYTIKDIAQMAGVSAGTVDRVLHQRGEVSENSKKKVERILKEINYQPNVYAIGLAGKRKYHLGCFIPKYVTNDYWYAVVQGIEKALAEVQPFNISVDFIPCWKMHLMPYSLLLTTKPKRLPSHNV